MSVKAFYVGKISGHFLFLARRMPRPIDKYWGVLFFAILLFGGQPAHAAQAAAATTDAPCDFIASDETSFNLAINCANTAGPGTYTITVTNDISLTQPSLVLTNSAATQITLEGNGHAVDANGHGRVLTVESIQNLTLHNLTLAGGNATTAPGSTDGGGLSLFCGQDVTCHWTLQNTVVRNNQANDGGGIDYFCGNHGGGDLLVQDSVIRDNQAVGAGGGLIYGSDEESFACSVTLRNTLIEGNQAVDGGAFRILRPRVNIIDSTIRNNIATQNGGGLMASIGDGFITTTVRNSTISGNRAGLNGGGLYIESPDQTFDIKLINSTVSSNTATAGGGFYLRESNSSLRIALLNSTVTQNAASQGAGVHIFDQESGLEFTSTLRLTNSIIANNLGSACGGEAAAGVVLSGQRVVSYGHNLDSDASCLTPAVRQASDIPNGHAQLGPLANNGGPTLTHALLAGSQAIDAGDDAVCAAEPVNGLDQRGVARPQGAHCDIGAYEAATTPPPTGTFLFVSAKSSGQAGGIKFRDEDILAYDLTHATWHMVFDGSKVGVTKDVDAFHFLPDGTLLLSFNGPTDVPGLGKVDDSDIVRFIPTALGDHTAGSFAWYLRGQDVGLTTDGADIDAIGFTADGHLVVSTIGDFNMPNATGRDEDLFQLNNATFGNPSRGTWSQYFDGSAVGLANEDINSLWIDPTKPEFYLTVKDSFAFDRQHVGGNDIFICTLSQTGACSYRLFWVGAQHGYSAKHLDGVGIGALPPTFNPSVQADAAAQANAADTASDDDSDDLDVEEGNLRLFLPLVTKVLVDK